MDKSTQHGQIDENTLKSALKVFFEQSYMRLYNRILYD